MIFAVKVKLVGAGTLAVAGAGAVVEAMPEVVIISDYLYLFGVHDLFFLFSFVKYKIIVFSNT